MKNKLLLFSLVVLVALTTSLSPVLAFPQNYVVDENFNSDNANWVSSDNTVFEYGRIANAANPFYLADGNNNYFGTDLGVTYGANKNVTMTSPVYDFSTVVAPEVEFDFYAQAFLHPQLGGDGAYLQYNIGSGWVTVGTLNDVDGTNWYDANLHYGITGINDFGNVHVWNNSASAWKNATYAIPALALQNSVQFRFVFKSYSSPSGEGFGFDNFKVAETAPANSAEVFSLTSPVSTTCSFTAAENITAVIKNLGTSTMISGSYKVSYNLDNGGYTGETIVNSDLTGGATYTKTWSNIDLSAANSHTIDIKVEYGVAFGSSDISTTTVTANGILPIAAFPYTANFASAPAELGLTDGSDATATVANGVLTLAGGAGTTWVSSSEFTTSSQAWNTYTDNQASAFTCNINATTLSTIDLQFDLAQVYGYLTNDGGPGYSFFRVLVDGTPVADMNGVSEWNADGSTIAFETLRFNLDSKAGSNFNLTLQASNKRSNDFVQIDNLIIRQRLANDLAIISILAPETSCGLSTEAVTIRIENRGTSTQSNFPVYYFDGTNTISENFIGSIAAGQFANFTFAATADFANGLVLGAGVNLGTDGNASNDDLNGYVVDNLGDDIGNGDFTSDFNVSSGDYIAEDVNNNGSTWEWGQIGSDICVSINYMAKSANDFLYTSCLTFGDANQDYQVSFNYKTQSNTVSKTLTVYLMNAQTNTAVASTLLTFAAVNTNLNWNFASKVFNVPAAGVYYIAFKASGSAANVIERILLDNIVVREFIPSDLSFGTLTFDAVADPSDCAIPNPVSVEATITNLSGGTIFAGEQIQVVMKNGATTIATENVTLAANLAATNTVDYTFTHQPSLASVGTRTISVTVNYTYDNASGNNTASQAITTYGYPTALSVSGLADGYCKDATAVNLTTSYTAASGSGYTESITGTNVTGTNPWSYDPTAVTNSAITYAVEDVNGCSAQVTYTVVVTDPSVNLGADAFVTYGNYPTLDAGAGYTYSWSTGETTQTIVPDYFGTYSVTVTDSYCSVNSSKVVGQTEEIELREGWGFFSSLIDYSLNPQDFSTLVGPASLVIAKTFTENAPYVINYWPQFSVDDMGNIAVGAGYQYKAPADYTLSINGLPVVPELTPISLYTGYNFVGYLRQTPSPAATEFAGIANNIFIAKDQDGKVFWPAFSVNTIGDLTPGQAYKIKMTAPAILTYTANSNNIGKSFSAAEPVHFRTNLATGSNMTIGIPVSAWDLAPAYGDEVAVFSASGKLVGSAVYNGENLAIAVFGNDLLSSEKAALTAGESFQIKVWNQIDNQEVVCAFNQTVTYTEDAVVVIEKLALTNNGELVLNQNMPNPSNGLTEISFSLPTEGQVVLSLYNILGEEVSSLINETLTAGQHSVMVSTANLASGSYIYKMIANGQVISKQMTVK